MASGVKSRVEIVMEDDTTLEAMTDQRDAAAFERSDSFTENGIHTRIRYMGWNSLKRTGQTKLSWGEFDKKCVDAWIAKDEDVDPTETDQPSTD